MTSDGRWLIFTETTAKMGDDVMQMELEGAHRVTPLVQSPFNDRNGMVSPDGRWLAYETDESGRPEILVRPYPDVNSGRWPVSNTGGTRPLWAGNGMELFYASRGVIMRVGVERGASWQPTTPTLLIKEGYYLGAGNNLSRTYDISSDGKRFLMLKNESVPAAEAPKLIVVQHWADELKRLVGK
jgi:eukaryotic-like serine/threonine-protein kinase